MIDLGRHFGGADSYVTFENGAFTTTAGLKFQRLIEDRLGYNNFTSPSLKPIPPGAVCGVAGLTLVRHGEARQARRDQLGLRDRSLRTDRASALS